MTPPLVWLFWPLFGLYSNFVPSLCLLEVPNNEQKSLILASKRPRRSDLTSDLEFVAQITYATMFVLAV